MTSTRKSIIISTLFAMAISTFLIGYALLESGKEAIQLQMQDALKETIAIDFHRRENAEAKHIGKPLNRKVKGIKMIEKNRPITIVFKDSVEEFMAEQWVSQYILSLIHPVNPDDFNTLFNKELNKRDISCRTGIIYRQKGKSQYIGGDLSTFPNSLITRPVMLDVKNTVSIQAWANCNLITTLKHANKKTGNYVVVLCLVVIAFVLSYKGKKRIKDEEHTTDIMVEADASLLVQKGIRADKSEHKIYIDDKVCFTTDSGFKIMQLLIDNPNHFASKEEIILKLWPGDKEMTDYSTMNNRMNGHVNALRKTLRDFPGYQIETEHSKGYHLIIPASETSTPT